MQVIDKAQRIFHNKSKCEVESIDITNEVKFDFLKDPPKRDNFIKIKSRKQTNIFKIQFCYNKKEADEMRIIAGTARGVQLETLPGEDIVRPTINRVKEGMFSAIQFLLPGAVVLDLFAGSGQLGIEALSRGASRCVFCEKNTQAAAIVQKNCRTADVFSKSKVVCMDAQQLLAGTKEKFDIVLLDPPYNQGILQQILPQLDKVTKNGAVIVCESELQAELPSVVNGLYLQKQYKYGTVRVSKYLKQEESIHADCNLSR